MIENEYSRQEDSHRQQIADLEEEKEQLQVSMLWYLKLIWRTVSEE